MCWGLLGPVLQVPEVHPHRKSWQPRCSLAWNVFVVLYLTDEYEWVWMSYRVANVFGSCCVFMIRFNACKCSSERKAQIKRHKFSLCYSFVFRLLLAGIYFDAMEITPPAVGIYRFNKEDQTVRAPCKSTEQIDCCVGQAKSLLL